MKSKTLAVGVIVLASAALSACSTSGSSQSPTTLAPPRTSTTGSAQSAAAKAAAANAAVRAAQAAAGNAATSTMAAAPTSTAATVVLHAAPATNLHDGEVVQVTVSGFPPGKVFLSECAAAADVNALGCGAQLAEQQFVVIGNGVATGSFTVTIQAASMP